MMRTLSVRSSIPLIVVVLLLAVGCSSETTDTTTATVHATVTTPTLMVTTTVSVTTTVPVTTTTIEQTTTTAPDSDADVTVTKDIVFLEMDGHEYLVDVYVPTGEGLWPVAVNFHGIGPGLKDDSYVTVVAQAAAAAGMVVFAPNWVTGLPNPNDLNPEFIESAGPVYACALAFAQQEAAAYGGDPDHTVAYGYSGGVAPALPLAVGPISDLPPGCLTQVPPIAPVGAVLGDGDHFFHLAFWDGSFETEADAMQAFVAARVDPASWTADQSTRFHIWAAADGTYPRLFDDPWDEEGWLAQRDPDGTIREDLDELDELDDGVITYIDGGLLLATRMQQAGFEATFDLSPGGHTRPGDPSNLVAYLPEVVTYFLDAAGNS